MLHTQNWNFFNNVIYTKKELALRDSVVNYGIRKASYLINVCKKNSDDLILRFLSASSPDILLATLPVLSSHLHSHFSPLMYHHHRLKQKSLKAYFHCFVGSLPHIDNQEHKHPSKDVFSQREFLGLYLRKNQQVSFCVRSKTSHNPTSLVYTDEVVYHEKVKVPRNIYHLCQPFPFLAYRILGHLEVHSVSHCTNP